jgi:hypothetical protein
MHLVLHLGVKGSELGLFYPYTRSLLPLYWVSFTLECATSYIWYCTWGSREVNEWMRQATRCCPAAKSSSSSSSSAVLCMYVCVYVFVCVCVYIYPPHLL